MRYPPKKHLGEQPLTHRLKWAEKQFAVMLADGSLKGKFRKPDSLTILTVSNYLSPTMFEISLMFLGVKYQSLEVPKGEWKSIYKTLAILHYLKNTNKDMRTPYVLYCDARDVILRDDPQKIVDVFESKAVDLLFSSTDFKGGFACMPDVLKWAQSVALKRVRYLNAGVFIGTWDFTTEVFEEAVKYVTPNSLTGKQISALGYGAYGKRIDTRLCEQLPDFPKNSTDQHIFRYLHRQFYPRLDIDYCNDLAYRT